MGEPGTRFTAPGQAENRTRHRRGSPVRVVDQRLGGRFAGQETAERLLRHPLPRGRYRHRYRPPAPTTNSAPVAGAHTCLDTDTEPDPLKIPRAAPSTSGAPTHFARLDLSTAPPARPAGAPTVFTVSTGVGSCACSRPGASPNRPTPRDRLRAGTCGRGAARRLRWLSRQWLPPNLRLAKPRQDPDAKNVWLISRTSVYTIFAYSGQAVSWRR